MRLHRRERAPALVGAGPASPDADVGCSPALPRPGIAQKSTEKCFAICVPKPGSTLSSKEQTCLANCLDRYIDTMKAVSTTLMKSE